MLAPLAPSLHQETISGNPQSRGRAGPASLGRPGAFSVCASGHAAVCAFRAKQASTWASSWACSCACESVRLPCSVEAPSSLGPWWDDRLLKYGPSWPLAPGGVIPHTEWGHTSPHMLGVLLPYLSQQVIPSFNILSDLIHICSLFSSQALWFLPDFMVFKLLF